MRKIIFAALLLSTAAMAADGPNLRVVATNIQSDEGKLHIRVYDKKDDWLSDRYRTQKSVAVAGNRTGDRMTVELLLPAGEYALSVFQDVDDDGRLKSNFMGIPREPAGLSNNVRPRFGPPKYQDATFTVTAGAVTEQKIALR
ncbi:MAG: DUF2141 domain-containing protein [Gammaproteobacteria bacterium]|nr:DUF2141 domain-containing protein [Gammaproteobacteria bacterium]MDH5276216.1 DUF2141 domain-containing protein [Gammaproteobacteria bacterium]